MAGREQEGFARGWAMVEPRPMLELPCGCSSQCSVLGQPTGVKASQGGQGIVLCYHCWSWDVG